MQIEKLSVGSHKSAEDGACVMEFVSLLANEPFSDRPQCASASITRFCIWINDSGDQEHRDRLLVLAPRIVNTKDFRKEPARAALYSEFAFWNSEQAKRFAKCVAKSAEYVESAAKSAEYAKSVAEYAKCAAKYAKSAAKSAESAKSAAKSAESAKSAAKSAKYAKSAAKSAESAAEYTDYTAKYADYAAFRKQIFDKAIETLEKVLAV